MKVWVCLSASEVSGVRCGDQWVLTLCLGTQDFGRGEPASWALLAAFGLYAEDPLPLPGCEAEGEDCGLSCAVAVGAKFNLQGPVRTFCPSCPACLALPTGCVRVEGS
jgi:hypothetical protein